jgi:signal transduction histidine kinase/DNA-binding LacI/PurR family transcriptional regulator
MIKYRQRVTVGLVINSLGTEYQQEIWRGVEDAARLRGVNVVVFEGGCIDPPHPYERLRNLVYNRISASRIDGLIITSTTIGSSQGPAAMESVFSDIVKAVPTVCIGKGIPGARAVSVNNHSGIEGLVDHLVTVHGRKHFVFLGVSESNPDMMERLAAFRQALARHNLEPAPDAILQGEYRAAISGRLLKSWIDLGHPFDAVVAANDEMAFGSLKTLMSLGYDVPLRVSVTGFDDIPSARRFSIPLTTSFHPMYDIAVRAFTMLMDGIETGEYGPDSELSSRPIIRQSCGCLSRAVLSVDRRHALTCPDERDPSCDGITLPSEFPSIETSFRRLMERPGDTDAFLFLFRSALLRDSSLPTFDAPSWNAVVSRLGSLVSACSEPRACETVLHQARIMVQEFSEAAQAGYVVREYLRHRSIMYSVADFIGSSSLQSLFERMCRSLPDLGVNAFYLSLFVPGTDGERSRLLFGIRDRTRIPLPDSGVEFASDDLFPPELCETGDRFSVCAEMLFHDDVVQGMIVIGISREDIAFTDVLSRQIRGALRSSLLVDELVDKDEKLNLAFNQLSVRAAELERATGQIREDHQRLVAADKMASLGRLTAGIAHEINTPLAAVRASLSELGSLVRELRSSIDDPEVVADDYQAIASDMQRSLDLACTSSEQASRYLRSVKNQTRDCTGDSPCVSFDAVPVLKDSVVLLGHALRVGKCQVEFDLPESPVIVSGAPGRLSQIMTNLVSNAIDAMSPGGGLIRVSVRSRGADVLIVVSDTGCGIPRENLSRIFEPLFTTKPYGVGTGLGLSIVHDIVCGEFGGRIEVSSDHGNGATFSITLPQGRGEGYGKEI